MAENILIWTSAFPPSKGGVQSITKQLGCFFKAQGHNVFILTQANSIFHEKKEAKYGLEIYYCWHNKLKYKKNIFYNLLNKIQHNKISGFITSNNIQKANIHYPDIQIPYLLEYIKSKPLSFTISFQGNDLLQYFEEGNTFSFSRLKEKPSQVLGDLQALMNSANGISFCSSWLLGKFKNFFTQIPDNKLHIIHNSFNKHSNKPNHFVKEKYLFCYGNLLFHKGTHVLIEAYAEAKLLKADLPVLILAGDGPFKNEIINLVDNLDLHNKIRLIGAINDDQVAELTTNSEVNIIPSLREPFGIVALECLQSLKPLICSNVGGLPEAAGQYANYFNPFNTQELVQLLINYQNLQKFSEDEINTHLQNFQIEEIGSKFLRFINSQWAS